MASEIRVLEDQLYDADYQNRVLRDELRRARENCAPSDSSRGSDSTYGPAPEPSIDSLEPPIIIPTPDPETHNAEPDSDPLDIDNPFKDEPSGADTPPSMEAIEDAPDRAIPSPLADPPPAELPAPKPTDPETEDILPGIPEPPQDTTVPKIVPVIRCHREPASRHPTKSNCLSA